jgi:FAD-dependent urate hydroxylase
MRVLIVGAGIVGLAAAKGLHAAGHQVTVLERAPALRDGGGAIILWNNATAVLRDLGLDPEEVGYRLDGMDVRSSRGRRVTRVDTTGLADRFGTPAVSALRGTLIHRLANGLPEGTVHFDTRFTGVRDDGNSVRVETEGGAEYTADLLIGADGVRSGVRAVLHGPGTGCVSGADAKHTGVATWLAYVPAPFDFANDALMYVGRGGQVGLNPALDGMVQAFFDVPWDGKEPADPLAHLRGLFAKWDPTVGDLLDSLTADDLQAYPHRRHRIPLRWRHRRSLLAGDALHAMPPIAALGTGQGLEDVAALLRCLDGGDLEAGLRSYGRDRRRQAMLASMVATRSMAMRGPRTLLQSEPLMRMAGNMPASVATWSFERVIRGVSARA